ncbi:dual specificity protein phosphatase family protein [Haloglomus halophilum]|uniref:dual specificity protein phosphatase family protein n=1 Tax=Haloglomus halophilum TaxID=2962672 RepID=UPI0020CA0FAD|nr:dual specificity protein phosphatase family protein [Haloglomus halophilum]
MSESTERIVIGGIRRAGLRELYQEYGIEAVVRVTDRWPREGYPDGVTIHSHPMDDGSRNRYEAFVRGAARVLHLLRETNETLLVHCTMGASRSVGVAAAALAVHAGGTVDEWVDRLATHDRRPTEQVLTHARQFVEAVSAKGH